MSIIGDILDTALDALRSEYRWRREHPEETARMFRQREAFWKSRGRKALARAAARRAKRWEARVPKEVTPK